MDLQPFVRLAICVSHSDIVFFQVEGLMDDIDFKAKVTRAEFEELCADLFERVPRPVQDALTAAEMNMVSILIALCNLIIPMRRSGCILIQKC